MERTEYPTNLSDGHWTLIEPMLPPASEFGALSTAIGSPSQRPLAIVVGH